MTVSFHHGLEQKRNATLHIVQELLNALHVVCEALFRELINKLLVVVVFVDDHGDFLLLLFEDRGVFDGLLDSCDVSPHGSCAIDDKADLFTFGQVYHLLPILVFIPSELDIGHPI